MTTDGEYLLEVRLPFVREGAATAAHSEDTLTIQVDGQRRGYLLPKFLAYYTLIETRTEKGRLRARFAQPRA